MLSSVSFTALAAALSLTFANAAPATLRRLTVRDSNGPTIENEYIVKLKNGANTTSHIDSLPFAFSVDDTNSPVTHSWSGDFFNGYSGTFVGATLDAILSSPDVEYVEKNAIVRRMPLSLTSYVLNHTHSSASLIHKHPHPGTSKPSAPRTLSAAWIRPQ
jgi:hypothetical protein